MKKFRLKECLTRKSKKLWTNNARKLAFVTIDERNETDLKFKEKRR